MIIGKLKRLLRIIRKFFRNNPDKFLKQVSGVIHVGASYGQERDLYKTYNLNVIWIEPIPEVYNSLVENLQGYKSQIAFQALITDIDDKEYEFHIANNRGASSSILEMKQHKDIWPGVYYTKNEILKSITLATLVKKENIDTHKYQGLIIDTQGAELLVLRGTIPILRNFKYIKIEVPNFESYEGCCQVSDINSFMLDHGYIEFSRNEFAKKVDVGSYFDIVFKTHG